MPVEPQKTHSELQVRDLTLESLLELNLLFLSQANSSFCSFCFFFDYLKQMAKSLSGQVKDQDHNDEIQLVKWLVGNLLDFDFNFSSSPSLRFCTLQVVHFC